MELTKSKPEEVEALVCMSKAAFDTDVEVGAPGPGGPPEYDNLDWHRQMLAEGRLYSAREDGALVGGALLFEVEEMPGLLYVGRIFVDPARFGEGLGLKLMREVEALDPAKFRSFYLDTPLWNARTNRFYQKLGYREDKRDADFAYYIKTLE